MIHLSSLLATGVYKNELHKLLEYEMDCKFQLLDHSLDQSLGQNDVYQCVLCKKYKKAKDKLWCSVYYLDSNRFGELLSTITLQEINEYKPLSYTSSNILDSIFIQLLSFSGIDKTLNFKTLDQITHDCTTSRYRHLMNIEIEANAFYEIFTLICKRFPSLITETHLKNAYYYKNKQMVQILSEHFVAINPMEKCYICCSDYTNNLIYSTCSCNMMIHLDCLLMIINKMGPICKTCNCSFNAVSINVSYIAKKDTHIIFPSKNIYRQSISGQYIIIDDNDNIKKLTYAILYLQTDIVENILTNISNNDLKKFIHTADYMYTFSNSCTKLRFLSSNMSRHLYAKEYDAIELMLFRKILEF